MNVSYWISRRLQLRQGEGSGSSAGVIIAISGIALAVMVMELTLAIVVGFKGEIRHKLMGFDAQISIAPAYNPPTGSSDSGLRLTPELLAITDSICPDADIRLSLRQPGILKTDDNFQGAVFIGQSADAPFGFERQCIVEGQWPDYADSEADNDIVISRTMADALTLGIGDKVYSTFIIGEAVKLRRSTIAGIYDSNFGEYDRTIVYASLAALQRIAMLDSLGGTRVDVRGLPDDEITKYASELQAALVEAASAGKLDGLHPVSTILETGALYYNWLALLDTNVIVIFALMLCVAAFTLISCLFILILERVRTIGVLRAIGADKETVRRIFRFMAMRLVLYGLSAGNILGLGLLFAQAYTHIIPLNPEMYYLSWVPVVIDPLAIILLNIGVAAASWIILVLPSHLASSVDPAKAMHYE